jgi:hypothetical protein
MQYAKDAGELREALLKDTHVCFPTSGDMAGEMAAGRFYARTVLPPSDTEAMVRRYVPGARLVTSLSFKDRFCETQLIFSWPERITREQQSELRQRLVDDLVIYPNWGEKMTFHRDSYTFSVYFTEVPTHKGNWSASQQASWVDKKVRKIEKRMPFAVQLVGAAFTSSTATLTFTRC